MARLARVIAVNTAHHITQRGNDRRFVLESDSDRAVYLELLQHYGRLHRLSVSGYCLMSNHVHLIAIPETRESLPLTLKNAHGRYAAYFNARRVSSGHVWQGRYYSCPLDTPHLWAALRYVEMNPVRAGLAAAPEDYAWSSAAMHCAAGPDSDWIDSALWRQVWTPAEWKRYLGAVVEQQEIYVIRRSTHAGRPLGTAEFVRGLETTLKRNLAPIPGGRPPKRGPDGQQEAFAFGSL